MGCGPPLSPPGCFAALPVGIFGFHWSASEPLGPRVHLYMKSPLMWAELAFDVGEHDKQVGFPFHTNRPVLSEYSQRLSNQPTCCIANERAQKRSKNAYVAFLSPRRALFV